MKTVQNVLCATALIIMILTSLCYAQATLPPEPDSIRQSTINVFLDCPYCDFDYVRTEIPYVNYVRDRFEADVHVLITEQTTGGGGTEYTLDFIGKKHFAGMEDTLTYYSLINNTDDEVRRGLIRTLELGLARYLARTPLAGSLSINYELKANPIAIKDKWHHWVFTVSPAVQFYGYSSNDAKQLTSSLNFATSRVTYAEKTLISAFGSYSEYHQEYLSYPGITHKTLSINRNWDFDVFQVWSINDHWSAGALGTANGSSNAYSSNKSRNISAVIAPTLEYDIFPYTESTRRLFSIDYSLGSEYYYRYQRPDGSLSTYSKWHPLMELTAGLAIIQPWGNISAQFSNRQYLNNIKHNSQVLSGQLSWRISEGLFLNFDAQWTRNNGFPPELERSNRYYYSTRIGFTGVFGSIYNNIVNPRMIF